ncbi:hypothetical protein JNW88_00005, partial [Micromonospora sp. ATA32]|nr:hypothetical protein [Micromonospora sp. ATA32]
MATDPDLPLRWWAVPPRHQVSHLSDVDPELLWVALDPPPAAAPVVVRYRPAAGAPMSDLVVNILDELDAAAITMFPRWLPGADRLDGPAPLGVAAVRALA